MATIPYREILNNIVTRNRLQVTYSVTQEGPDYAARWVGTYTLQGVGVIGSGSSTAKVDSKELAAWQAVVWLDSRGYRA